MIQTCIKRPANTGVFFLLDLFRNLDIHYFTLPRPFDPSINRFAALRINSHLIIEGTFSPEPVEVVRVSGGKCFFARPATVEGLSEKQVSEEVYCLPIQSLTAVMSAASTVPPPCRIFFCTPARKP
jgi:hypothetical protein